MPQLPHWEDQFELAETEFFDPAPRSSLAFLDHGDFSHAVLGINDSTRGKERTRRSITSAVNDRPGSMRSALQIFLQRAGKADIYLRICSSHSASLS